MLFQTTGLIEEIEESSLNLSVSGFFFLEERPFII